MGSSGTSAAISIDVTKDLESSSDLKSLLSANSNVLVQLASELAKFAGQPVSAAVGTSSPTLTLTATLPSWTAGPVTFSLTPTATCTITIGDKGEDFEVATKVDDTTSTTNVQLPAAAGMTYVNIDLDFTLAGSASESGTTTFGLTITGKAAGSAATTLSFCQPVPSDTLTLDALKLAFSNIVFPTGTGSLKRMVPGSSCRMNFDGSLNLGVTASYGLGPYMLSASSAANVISSIEKVVPAKITLPTAQVNVGATASVTYAHTDHFGLVIEKQDANTALLYLIRSAKNEFGESAGITVEVTTTDASVTLDTTQIQQTVQSVTGSADLAGKVGDALSNPVNNLATSALAKLNTWIDDANGTTGLSVALDQQKGRTALFNYSVDLTQPAANQSWDSLLTQSLPKAMEIPGFTLLAGSGVAEQLKRSTTFQFNFFNLYTFKDVTNFFNTWSAELAPDGTIRLVSDIGMEQLASANSASDTMRIHFTSTATEDVLGDVSKAEIDLNIEISEKNDPKGAAVLVNLLGIVEPGLPAIKAMSDYVTANPGGTLNLIALLDQTAYAKLPFSPYTPRLDGKPPVNQNLDRANWDLIHNNLLELKLGSAPIVAPLSYDDWTTVNIVTNGLNPGEPAARRLLDSPVTAISSTAAVWHGFPPLLVDRFLTASSRGMNLFEDLVTLANDLKGVTTGDQFKLILKDVTSIVDNDVDFDFSKPIAAAILKQAAAQSGVTVTASTAEAKDSTTFTTTLTIA
jgi:hypothetical protein